MRLKKWIIITLSIVFISTMTACSSDDPSGSQTDEQINSGEQTGEQTESDGDVITIQDKTFTYDDIAFHQLMNKVKIALQLEKDLETLHGEEADDRTQFWNEQMAYYDHFNANLQSLIEIYSMALLAEEKNYFVPEEKLENFVNEFADKVAGNEKAEQLISDFGESEYKYHLREYIRQMTLRDRVAAELEKEIKEENPDLSEHEINYLLSQKYEDLHADQVASLELEIHVQ